MSAAALTFYLETRSLESSARPSLLAKARRGNREAFAEMVTPYVPSLYRRARRMTGNSADAEDVSQEALLKAWSRLKQFSGTQDENSDDFRAWVSRIGANASIDLLRSRRDNKLVSLEERVGASEETLGSGIAARDDNPEQRCARREMGRLLASAIVQLPPDLRQACLLRDVMHYSTQEVAERLGISLMAVRLRLFRAHRRLREKLEDGLRPRAHRRGEEASKLARSDAVENASERLAPLEAAASYACGD